MLPRYPTLIVALFEYVFYDGHGAIVIPINLAIASLAGLIAVKKHLADLRRKDRQARSIYIGSGGSGIDPRRGRPTG